MNKYISTFCLCATLLIFSCTDPNLIGLEVQPPSAGIKVALTTADNNLTIHTISEDSLRSDETSTLLLGAIYDPIFGYNNGSFLTQILLSGNNIDLGDFSELEIDSAFLNFSYSGYEGDLSCIQAIDVSPLEVNDPFGFEGIFKDSVYYSNYPDWNTHIWNWAESFDITPGDSTNPTLKIKLLNYDLSDFLENAISENALTDNTAFLQYFYGFYVTILPISGICSPANTILYLNPTGQNSKMSIYYHNINDVDSVLSLDFSLSGDVARINLFNDKPMSQLLQQADTSVNTYVQSMAGYKTVVEIENLDTLKIFFKGKAINRVNLSFELDGTDTADFPPHGRMYLVRVDNEGRDYFLTDYIVEGEDHFGGKLENGKYTFNITRYFLQLLNNEDYTNKLYLVAAGGAVNAKRTILPKDKISFNIIYTDL